VTQGSCPRTSPLSEIVRSADRAGPLDTGPNLKVVLPRDADYGTEVTFAPIS
jgi:hypothetical protein